ncbi:MAG: hypothetical protein ABIR37_00270 [Candidatus Saccharimonadales bacterium]
MAPAFLIGILAVPVVLMTLLRINAPLVFLSVCLGSVLVRFVGPDALDLVHLFSPKSGNITESTLQLILLLVPVVLTMLFMIRSVKGNRVVFNILPAAGASFLLLLLVKPLLSPGLIGTITASPLWAQIERSQDLVVGASALICLFFLWLQRPKHESDKKHK